MLNVTNIGLSALNGGVTKQIVNVTDSQNVYNSSNVSLVVQYDASVNVTVIGNLKPDTVYLVTLTLVVLGGATITSQPIYVHTMVGGLFNIAFFILNFICNNLTKVRGNIDLLAMRTYT